MSDASDQERISAPPLIDGITEDAGRLSGASRGRVLAILALVLLLIEVIPLQIQVGALILSKIGATFPSAGSNVSWTITISLLVGGATMAMVGKAGDVFGKKRVLIVLSLICAVGLLLSAFATDWALFLTGRGISGVGLGLAVVDLSLVRDLIPRRMIPIAVGFVGTGLAISGIIGPLIGGLLTDHYSWRSIYWFLFIYTLVITPLFALFVPESPVRIKQRFDVPGGVLFGAGIAGVAFYLSEGTSWGWGSGKSLGYLIGGLVVLAAFVAWEARIANPMLDLALIRRPAVYLVIIAGFLVTGFQTITNVIIGYLFETPPQQALEGQILQGAATANHVSVALVKPFAHFQGTVNGAGYSFLQVAYHITIWTAIFALLAAPLGGWLCRKVGARIPLIISAVSIAIACAAWIPWHSTWQEQVFIGILGGLGSGFYFAVWPNLIMDAVPVSQQGISAGMVQVFGGIGGTIFTASIASVLAAHAFQVVFQAPGRAAVTEVIPQVYTDGGFQASYLLLGVIPAVLVLVIGLVIKTGRTPARGGAPAEAAEAAPVAA